MTPSEALRNLEELIEFLGEQQGRLALGQVGARLREMKTVLEKVCVEHEKRLTSLESSLEQARDAFRKLQQQLESQRHNSIEGE